MNTVIAKHILEKHFGKNNPKVEYALIELKQLINHPLDEVVVADPKSTPAYIDASEENLDDGHCRLCRMVWYSCLCSHDD
jgi:hypothetical protein